MRYYRRKIVTEKKVRMSTREEFGRVALQLGRRAEEIVLEAFDSEREKATWPEWLYDCEYSEAYSKSDQNGIDFAFMTDKGPVFVQIKSSEAGARKFEKADRYRKNHIKIRVVVVDVRNTLHDIYLKVLSEISSGRNEF